MRVAILLPSKIGVKNNVVKFSHKNCITDYFRLSLQGRNSLNGYCYKCANYRRNQIMILSNWIIEKQGKFFAVIHLLPYEQFDIDYGQIFDDELLAIVVKESLNKRKMLLSDFS